MRVPNAVHRAHGWLIDRVAPDFELLDVWGLPVEGGRDDFGAFVETMLSIDPVETGSILSGDRQAVLETLSVAPSMRGQGLGTRLVSAVRDRLADAGIETLAVGGAARTNAGAHRFYERHGFRIAEVVFVGATGVDT